MSPLVVIAVLGAALLHSTWHAMIKDSPRRMVGLAGMNVFSAGVALLAAPFVPVPRLRVWAVLAVSVVLHNAYKFALTRLYAVGDLSHSYPLARGISPLAATLLAALFLGELPGLGQLAGIATISLGVVCLATESFQTAISRNVLITAALTGLSVAGYSVVDGYGVRVSQDWIGFSVWLMVVDGGCFVAFSRWHTGKTFWKSVALDSTTILISGTLGVTSFVAFLWALGRAPVGGVSALREVSVIFASLIGMIALKEKRTIARIAGAVLVTGGIAMLSLT